MIGLLRKQCFEYTETVGADIIRPLYAGQFSESHIIIGTLKRRPMNGRRFVIVSIQFYAPHILGRADDIRPYGII